MDSIISRILLYCVVRGICTPAYIGCVHWSLGREDRPGHSDFPTYRFGETAATLLLFLWHSRVGGKSFYFERSSGKESVLLSDCEWREMLWITYSSNWPEFTFLSVTEMLFFSFFSFSEKCVDFFVFFFFFHLLNKTCDCQSCFLVNLGFNQLSVMDHQSYFQLFAWK